jgi:hypothetical protein
MCQSTHKHFHILRSAQLSKRSEIAAAVLRSHVLNLRPLPKSEMRAFEQGVVQLSIIGRNLNQLVRMSNAKGVPVMPGREELGMFLNVCTAPHPLVHVVLKAVSEQGRRLNIRKALVQ